MSLSSRSLRRTVFSLLWVLSAACAAQQSKPQFNVPQVELTGGRVTDLLSGSFQQGTLPDLLYANAVTGLGFDVTAGELLNTPGRGLSAPSVDQITFSGVTNVSAAVADFDGDGLVDYAFALSPAVTGGADLCIYYGTGAQAGSGMSSYSGGNVYPPAGAKSGCTTFASFEIKGSLLPNFAYIAAFPFKTSGAPQLMLEDSANGYLYILAINGAHGVNGVLSGVTLRATIQLAPTDGPGPIYIGDFDGDGNTDFIVNGQTGNSAWVYLGDGTGLPKSQRRYTFDHNVHSMLLYDMDLDGHLDMVVEGDNGVIEIFHGNTDGSFATTSEGGTAAGVNGFSGNGGHLAAIGKLGNDANLDILTTTPIGLSVLQGIGNLQYQLRGSYNIGPGRSAFALADFNGDGYLDLAVDSPEGVALILGDANGDGGFQTSKAYAALQPALGATVGRFWNAANNPQGNLDVMVATGATQAQLLTGNGDGTFNTFAAPANTSGGPSGVPANLWSSVLAGDFNGDGNLDIAYSLTGLPLPVPGTGSGLYMQYGNGDGSFMSPVAATGLVGAPANNTFYGESTVGDFNGDGVADIANLDTLYHDTLLGAKSGSAFALGLNEQVDAYEPDSETRNSFSQVAAGVFSGTRTAQQDLLFQDLFKNGAGIMPYVNSGDGVHFTAMPALSGSPDESVFYESTILVADLDGDGCGDVIVPYQDLQSTPANPSASATNQLYIWYGNCDGTFGQPQIAALRRNYYLSAVGDMNNDGLPDLALSDGYLVSILYNQGNRSFGGEQHFLAGQGINSLALADLNGDGSLDLVVANGGATNSDAVAIGGAVQNAISLTPNPDVNTGGVTVLMNNITTKRITGTVTASPEPSKAGDAFTLTAKITPSAGVAAPTGTVTFSIAGAAVGTGTLAPAADGTNASTASYVVPAGNSYTQNEYTIAASYGGDAFNSTGTFFGQHFVAGVPTTTDLLLCIGPAPSCPSTGVISPPPPYMANLTMYYGQTWNGTTNTTASDGTALTGNITLYDDYNGTTTALCTLPAGMAGQCPNSVGTTQGTSVGTNVLTSVYSGDATHLTSTSPPVTITVLPDTTTATLISSANPSPSGQPVTFTATLTGNDAAPTGTVVFTEFFPMTGLVLQLGMATLVPGSGLSSTAAFTTSTLPVGTDPIVAGYAATMNFDAATSNTVNEVITPVFASSTTLVSSMNPSTVGQSVTFTATVTSPGQMVSGSVTFANGGTVLGSGTLSASGVATFTTTTLPVGQDTITATYMGGSAGGGAIGPSSASLVQTVYAPPAPGTANFTVTVMPNPVSVGVGLGAALTVTVTTLPTYTEGVNLSCGNMPTEAACTTASIAPGGGTATLNLTTAAPHNCDATQPYFLGKGGGGPGAIPFALPALAGLAVMLVPGRRRWLRGLVAVAAVAFAMQMGGCGNCTDLGTRPATYTIQVMGTAAGGTPEVESQSVTLNVTL
jgi:hypothetical protein